MKAPSPTLTSSASARTPTAAFLLRMLAVISGTDSTIEAASRSA